MELLMRLYWFFERVLLPLFLIGLPLLLLYLLYGVIRRAGLRRLAYRRYFSQEGVFAGETVSLVEEATNCFFLPLPRVEVESFVWPQLRLTGYSGERGEMQQFISRFFLLPHATVRRYHPLCCEERGCYQLESAGVWFRRDLVPVESRARLLVYPKPLAVEEETALDCYLEDQEQSMRPLIADPFTFSGIREYRTGDSFHSINFKATARHGRLCVNHTDFLTGRQVLIAINFQQKENGFPLSEYRRYMEYALSAAAYLLSRALSSGCRLGFLANSRMVNGARYVYFPLSSGTAFYEEILRLMANVRLVAGNSFASTLALAEQDGLENTELYVFTLHLDERTEERLTQLRRYGNTVQLLWPQTLGAAEERRAV